MSLPHALLTALIEESGSGLDLARRFDQSLGFFWSATHQQIYRELARMEAAGWIRSQPAQTGRGRKKIWVVQPEGRKELRRWARLAQEPPVSRHPLLVRLWAEAVVGGTRVHEELQRLLTASRQRLATYRTIEAEHFSGLMSRDRQLRYLTLSAGIHQEQAWITWFEEALRTLAA